VRDERRLASNLYVFHMERYRAHREHNYPVHTVRVPDAFTTGGFQSDSAL